MSPLVPVLVDEDEDEENDPRRTRRGPRAKMANARSAYLDAVEDAYSPQNTNTINRSESDTDSNYEGGGGG